ncbi:polar growth protein [Scheffersomyces spartinae]|uniref:Polar growth protein n=1 Tax=Scheffersomyces spartinae TaxID=45513 RepID=A0A9P8AJW4_9ASCO|nr:polar growth protein [Scheffersomyces spartinae]KAG7195255.1 polar growth protein [Scheffersomyces spartinae]
MYNSGGDITNNGNESEAKTRNGSNSNPQPQQIVSSEGTGAIFVCFKQFTKRLPDELSLVPGDKIEVLADDSEYNDGWYMGKNIITNEVGLYPKSFTKIFLVPSAQSGPLLRSRSRRISHINNANASSLDVSTYNDSSHANPNASSISYSSHNITDMLSGLKVSGNADATTISEKPGNIDPSGTATKTMNDIDKALEELKNDAFSSTNSGSRSSSPPVKQVPPTSLSTATSYTSSTSRNNGHNNAMQDSLVNSGVATKATEKASNVKNINSHKTPPLPDDSEVYLTPKTSERDAHARGLSLSEDFDIAKVKSWTPQQVSSYFALVLGFDLDILGKFARHKITGEILLELDLTLLKELDIDSFGTRYEIYKEIDKLKSMSTSSTKSLEPPSKSTFAKLSTSEDAPKHTRTSSKGDKPLPPVKKKDPSQNQNQNHERKRSNHSTSTQGFPRPPSLNHSNPNSNQSSSTESVDKKEDWKYYHETYTKSATSTPIIQQPSKAASGKHSAKGSIHQRQKLKDWKDHGRNVSQTSENAHLSHRKSTDLSFLSPRRPPEPPAPEIQGYKFGGDRSSSITGTTGLGITRPTSSIYDSSNPHTRNASKASGDFKNYFHSPNTPHKRHSSIFLFFTSNDAEDKDKERDLKSKDYKEKDLKPKEKEKEKELIKDKDNDVLRLKEKERLLAAKEETSPSTIKEHKTPTQDRRTSRSQSTTDLSSPALTSPLKLKKLSFGTPKNKSTIELYLVNKTDGSQNSDSTEIVDIDHVTLSPKKQKSLSVSYKSNNDLLETEDRRTASDSNALSRLKTLRTASAQNFRTLTGLKKLKTSAFTEGIREISPDEAIKTSTYLGWVSKKSSNGLSWKSRYFTLHGTRLSYFTSLKDKREKGLIDITAHKVIPILTEADTTNSNDRYVALYASSTGAGRYCFKVVPPAPGFRKGLTFTQPKTHYFAVETINDMRGWLKALMAATIDIDDTVPIVSSCSTPTVSLTKAQELLAKAREESRIKDEELRLNGFIRDVIGEAGGDDSIDINHQDIKQLIQAESTVLDESSFHPSPNVESFNTLSHSLASQHKLSLNTHVSSVGSLNATRTTPMTPQVTTQLPGFSSPYLLASGLLSPRTVSSNSPKSPANEAENSYFSKAMNHYHQHSGGDAPSSGVEAGAAGGDTNSSATSSNRTTMHTMNSMKKDNETVTTPKSIFSNSNGRVVSGGSKMKERLSTIGK